ncbi:hypothetical protein ROZALSC1DRAFT_22945 [Rozella allomycis CSF55]|uniref:Uncharacterized protein n=1 Tax=Rozella allomycis (strain CSF55) TaxID=988480 RepID=A0A4P9YGS9_ROZAC|nr:hypothetical protein ROZALSC1DRAFT_22945 [Rozella allomycis CSF55]
MDSLPVPPAPEDWPCFNMRFYYQMLKNLRKVDDTIINRLNKINTSDKTQCDQFLDALSKLYKAREIGISNCIKTLEEREKSGDSDSLTLKKQISMMKSDLVVEEIDRERSINLVRDRCGY